MLSKPNAQLCWIYFLKIYKQKIIIKLIPNI